MFHASWPALQQLLKMSGEEAKVVKVIVSAAVQHYKQTRELTTSVSLGSLVIDPDDDDERAKLAGILSKQWTLTRGHQMISFTIVGEWHVLDELSELEFSLLPRVMDLFEDMDMTQSVH